jgi:hypothetical protein
MTPKKPVGRPKRNPDEVLRSKIIATLRRLWLRSPERAEALKRAKVARKLWQCERCKEQFTATQCLHIHHIEEVGKFVDYDTFISRLFVTADKYLALCHACHLDVHDHEREQKKAKS